MKLTARQISSAEPKEKSCKLADGVGGMDLETSPNGTKSWRLKLMITDKEKRAVLGTYLSLTLAIKQLIILRVFKLNFMTPY
ncbi:Arm DNA-binding domain-containing protein [Pantoea sp.]|uniref:Arm DNA-binding domain-containing protein n=1 Tax=Pantoea sp. TaxID=69393 RepID=UPI0031E4355E